MVSLFQNNIIHRSDKIIKEIQAHARGFSESFIDLGTDEIRKSLELFDNPHDHLNNIMHIAGTNGKGSTAKFLARICKVNGYNACSFFSPHLVHYAERFCYNDLEFNYDRIEEIFHKIKEKIPKNYITYFEISTLIAILLCKEKKADFNIFETGLGGRLDSTNIFTKEKLAIITNISFDHTAFLGNDLLSIAKEKAGIITKNSTLISAERNEEVISLFKNYAKESYFIDADFYIKKVNDKLFFTSPLAEFEIDKPSLYGRHQIDNLALAIFSFIYQAHKKKIKYETRLINQAGKTTKHMGRLMPFEVKDSNKTYFLDGAHNEDGARILKNFIIEEGKKTILILSMKRGKDIKKYLQQFSGIVKFIALLQTDIDNMYNPEDLYKECKELSFDCKIYKSLNDIIKDIEKENYHQLENCEQVIITGSLYFVGDVLKKYG